MALRVAVLGGGSAYTPGLIKGLLRLKDELPLDELTLMDIEAGKLAAVGKVVEHMLAAEAPRTRLRLSTDRTEALTGADFVLCQIRVGGLPARSLDEKIPNRHGVIGQETTGPGGFAMALRTVPVMVDVARDMERLCPEAWLINYTNPTAMVAAGVEWYTNARVLSICDVPIGVQTVLAKLLGVDRQRIRLDYVGLNHLGWFRRVLVDGRDVLPRLREMAATLDLASLPSELVGDDPKNAEEFEAMLRLFQRLGVIPSPYLQYYYLRQESLEKQLRSPRTRADVVMDLEKELLADFRSAGEGGDPDAWRRRGAEWHADMMMGMVSAIHNDKREVHIVNVPNRGAVKGFDDRTIVEVPCVVDREGAHPMAVGEIEPDFAGLMHLVAAYERLTVEAAMEGSREKALRALSIHPLIPSIEVADRLLADLLDAHAAHLPNFHKH